MSSQPSSPFLSSPQPLSFLSPPKMPTEAGDTHKVEDRRAVAEMGVEHAVSPVPSHRPCFPGPAIHLQ